MRAGILSRFMGILGIVVAALTVFPVFGPPIVAIFWLGALGALFMNRWPGERGPAGATVEEIPWPSSMDKRQAILEGRDGGDEAEDDDYSSNGSGDWDDDEPADEESAARQHSSSKKRKRKRRR